MRPTSPAPAALVLPGRWPLRPPVLARAARASSRSENPVISGPAPISDSATLAAISIMRSAFVLAITPPPAWLCCAWPRSPCASASGPLGKPARMCATGRGGRAHARRSCGWPCATTAAAPSCAERCAPIACVGPPRDPHIAARDQDAPPTPARSHAPARRARCAPATNGLGVMAHACPCWRPVAGHVAPSDPSSTARNSSANVPLPS